MAIYPEHQATLLYGEEATQGSEAGTIESDFGIIQSVTPRISNKLRREYGIGGGRNAQQVKRGGQIDCGIDVTFKVINGWFLKYALGSVSGQGTAGDPYAYAEADSLTSLSIEDGFNLDTDQVLTYLGCLPARTEIRLRMNEPVMVTMQFVGEDISKNNTLPTVTVPATNIYEFVHGSFELPSGTTISEVQEAVLVIDNQVGLEGGIGSHTGTAKAKQRQYSMRMRANLTDGTHLDNVMGGSSSTSSDTPAKTATAQFDITDGSRYIRITLTDVWSDDWTAPQELNRPIEESVNFIAKSCAATEVL